MGLPKSAGRLAARWTAQLVCARNKVAGYRLPDRYVMRKCCKCRRQSQCHCGKGRKGYLLEIQMLLTVR